MLKFNLEIHAQMQINVDRGLDLSLPKILQYITHRVTHDGLLTRVSLVFIF